MDYNYFTLDDFVADDYFRHWVKQPNENSSLFWQTFLATHPEQAETVRLAADAVRKLSEATVALSAPTDRAEEAAVWHNVKTHVLAIGGQSTSPFLTRHRGTAQRWLVAAASLVALLGLGWWLQAGYSRPDVSRPVTVQALPAYVTQTNSANKPVLVSLPDGSSVMLQKGSHLRYPRQFSAGKRLVHLTGEAFFEVAKDPNRPFFVYTNELVTKVLGTSFNVRAYTTDKQVVVTVRSGRVAVFAQSDKKRQQKISSSTLDGVVLTPNQQLVVARQAIRLPAPKAITPVVARRVFAFSQANFQFDAAPVSEVFSLLERVYGISVVYDKETLGRCRLTADLTDEPLADKLLIICKSIEATYTITDAQLTISGPGCGS